MCEKSVVNTKERILKKWEYCTFNSKYFFDDNTAYILENQEKYLQVAHFNLDPDYIMSEISKLFKEFNLTKIFHYIPSLYKDDAYFIEQKSNLPIKCRVHNKPLELDIKNKDDLVQDIRNFITSKIIIEIVSSLNEKNIQYRFIEYDEYSKICFKRLESEFNNYLKNIEYNKGNIKTLICDKEFFKFISCFEGYKDFKEQIEFPKNNLLYKGKYKDIKVYLCVNEKLENDTCLLLFDNKVSEDGNLIDPTLVFSCFLPVNISDIAISPTINFSTEWSIQLHNIDNINCLKFSRSKPNE